MIRQDRPSTKRRGLSLQCLIKNFLFQKFVRNPYAIGKMAISPLPHLTQKLLGRTTSFLHGDVFYMPNARKYTANPESNVHHSFAMQRQEKFRPFVPKIIKIDSSLT